MTSSKRAQSASNGFVFIPTLTCGIRVVSIGLLLLSYSRVEMIMRVEVFSGLVKTKSH